MEGKDYYPIVVFGLAIFSEFNIFKHFYVDPLPFSYWCKE